MKKLEFKIEILATPQEVWDIMLSPDGYREWTEASWPGSNYEGNWEPGEVLRFTAPQGGGTVAKITECRPHEFILAEHIAVIKKNGTEDRDSAEARGWIGTTESYTFTGNNEKTDLKIQIKTNPEWEKMFTDGWPAALAKLKEICEK